MGQSCVSRRTRSCVLIMETLSPTTNLIQFPPRDFNMSFIALLALKLGDHVLKTLWKVWPCGKCETLTPIGHVQQQISQHKANSSKNLHVAKVCPVPPPACNKKFLFGCAKYAHENTELSIIQSIF
jgi:hypothetical protein